LGDRLPSSLSGPVSINAFRDSLRSDIVKKILILFVGLAIIFLTLQFLSNLPQFFSYQNGSGKTCAAKVACPDCNLILLSIDSLRADHVGAFGYKRDTTPNFDSFAKKGILFKNYFPTSFLTPVSEMSLQTGMYPTSNGVTAFDTVLPVDRKTLGEFMKQEDYQTSALLSSPEFWINPPLKESFERGFDSYKYSNADLVHARDLPGMNQVTEQLDKFSKKKSFLWMPLGRVHWPYGVNSANRYADKKYNGAFEDAPLNWQTFRRIYQMGIYNEPPIPHQEKLGTLTERDIQYVKDVYDNGVRSVDDFLGKLIYELRKRGLLEKTVIVIESEHGEALGEHGYFAHYDIFDEQIHAPLLIFSPKIKNSLSVDALVSSIDVLPTISELLGRVPPKAAQGRSLVPLICGEEDDNGRGEVFIERNPLWEEVNGPVLVELAANGINVGLDKHKDLAIRTNEWKYILRTSKKALEQISWWQFISGEQIDFPDAELYNLKQDPGETKNVILEYPGVAKELDRKLKAWSRFLEERNPNVKRTGEVQDYF